MASPVLPAPFGKVWSLWTAAAWLALATIGSTAIVVAEAPQMIEQYTAAGAD